MGGARDRPSYCNQSIGISPAAIRPWTGTGALYHADPATLLGPLSLQNAKIWLQEQVPNSLGTIIARIPVKVNRFFGPFYGIAGTSGKSRMRFSQRQLTRKYGPFGVDRRARCGKVRSSVHQKMVHSHHQIKKSSYCRTHHAALTLRWSPGMNRTQASMDLTTLPCTSVRR